MSRHYIHIGIDFEYAFPFEGKGNANGFPFLPKMPTALDTLSRLKGRETRKATLARLGKHILRYAFPVEGKGNSSAASELTVPNMLAIRFPGGRESKRMYGSNPIALIFLSLDTLSRWKGMETGFTPVSLANEIDFG